MVQLDESIGHSGVEKRTKFGLNKESVFYEPSVKWPKISIITPSYNQGKYIEQTILSVLDQQYPNLEYIIIDGGSTDETLSIIKKYQSRITYWISEKDSGQSHAINKGLMKCTGIIFNWLNSDDWYEPGCLQSVASYFMANSAVQVVSGYENHIQIDGSIVLSEGSFITGKLESTIEFCEIAQPSSFFKLSAIQNVGGVSEDLHYIMDGEMWVKLLLQYGQKGFYKIEKPLVNFRLHELSKTTSNTMVNNFLVERCSIITDLQRYLGVPPIIVNYYIEEIYQAPEWRILGRHWTINEVVISKCRLRNYFMKKYVVKQFRRQQPGKAFWGLNQLLMKGSFDWFLVKGYLKWLFKTYRHG
jgi:glycosyltransferase involved in cell wall biosynthesis